MRKFVFSALAAVLLAGCSYSDPGEGSGTLAAQAVVNYDFSQNLSTVRVSLKKNGDYFAGAQVVLTDASSDVAYELAEVTPGPADSDDIWNYLVTFEGYARNEELQVKAAGDNFWVKLEGPAHAVITSPEHNGRLERIDRDLKVTWRPDDGLAADEVSLFFPLSNLQYRFDDDIGQYKVPRVDLTAGFNEIILTRCNTGNIAGAQNSQFSICYQVSNIFQLFEK